MEHFIQWLKQFVAGRRQPQDHLCHEPYTGFS